MSEARNISKVEMFARMNERRSYTRNHNVVVEKDVEPEPRRSGTLVDILLSMTPGESFVLPSTNTGAAYKAARRYNLVITTQEVSDSAGSLVRVWLVSTDRKSWLTDSGAVK